LITTTFRFSENTSSFAAFGFQGPRNYSLRLTIRDSGHTPRITTTWTFNVTVVDVNDPPVALGPFAILVYENAATTVALTTLTAADQDRLNDLRFEESCVLGVGPIITAVITCSSDHVTGLPSLEITRTQQQVTGLHYGSMRLRDSYFQILCVLVVRSAVACCCDIPLRMKMSHWAVLDCFRVISQGSGFRTWAKVVLPCCNCNRQRTVWHMSAFISSITDFDPV
jgi:hypothetical protein